MDLSARTVKVKSLLQTKRFNLADGCTIVHEGKLSGEMRDLKLGDRITPSYEDVNGVDVANRIAETGPSTETPTALSGN